MHTVFLLGIVKGRDHSEDLDQGNEHSVSIKRRKFLDQLSDYQLLKEGSGSWSWLMTTVMDFKFIPHTEHKKTHVKQVMDKSTGCFETLFPHT
jgi:hypothetical protein